MSLEKQAAKAGGQVHALIGNHEAMNLYGDLRYTTAGEFAAFRTGQSEEVRAAFWDSETKSPSVSPQRRRPQEVGGRAPSRVVRAPHRVRAQREVRQVDPLAQRGSEDQRLPVSARRHQPAFANLSVDQINEMVAAELNDFSKLNDNSAVMAGDGPLWYRGMSQDEKAAARAQVDQVLAAFGVKQIVVGHTPTAGAVLPRYGGKVLVIDVGLSAHYGGSPGLPRTGGRHLYAVHRGHKVLLPIGDAAADLTRYLKNTVALEPMGSALAKHLAEVEAALAKK